MRLLAAVCVFVLAGCGDNKTAPASPDAPVPATPSAVENSAPEPVWNATGSAQAMIPEEFRGRWDATAESCQEISVAELKVADRALIFWEVGVDVRAVTPVGANAIRIEGTGHEEEESSDWAGVFQLSANGTVLTMNPGPNGFARVRCLTSDFPGAEQR